MTFAQALDLEYISYEHETKKERKNRLKRELYNKNKDKPETKAKRRESSIRSAEKIKADPLKEAARKEKANSTSREWAKNNKERAAANANKWNKNNKERAAVNRKRRRERKSEEELEALRETSRKYKRENRESVQETQRKWNKNNPDKIKSYNKQACKKPKKKMYNNLRKRFKDTFKKAISIGGHEALTGLPGDKLKEYIEFQFTPEMSWENWGKVWQLDHRIPINLCDENEEKFKRLNHFTNLQPLKVFDNLSKGDRLMREHIGYDLYHRLKDLLPTDFKEPNYGTEWELAICDPI